MPPALNLIITNINNKFYFEISFNRDLKLELKQEIEII